jgi:hypothetical protein
MDIKQEHREFTTYVADGATVTGFYNVPRVRELVDCLERHCLADDRIREDVGCGTGAEPWFTMHDGNGKCIFGVKCANGAKTEERGLIVCDEICAVLFFRQGSFCSKMVLDSMCVGLENQDE